MNTNSNINEETVYGENYNVESSANQVTNNGSAAKNVGKKSQWKKVAIGGATGIVMGTAVGFAKNMANGGETHHGEVGLTETGEGSEAVSAIVGDAKMAHSVNDDMSFNEAFAAARSEVGAGGVFEWHGNVYSTYYAEEWDAMSPKQQDDWAGNNSRHSEGGHHENSESSEHSEHQASNDVKPEEAVEPAEDLADGGKEIQGETAHVPEEPGDPEVVSTIEILGVMHDDESGANVATALVDGYEAVIVDVDDDHVFDMLLVDANQDGEFSAADGELADISDANFTVQQAIELSEANSNPGGYYADETDADYGENIDGGDYVG